MPYPARLTAAVFLLAASGAIAAPKDAGRPAHKPSVRRDELDRTAEGQTVVSLWAREKYAWTPRVSAAYLAFVKTKALKAIADKGQRIPSDFLAWVDATPEVALTVYGLDPAQAADRLRLLRSLEIDLGKETVRTKYTQLALALCVARPNEGATADLSNRKPLEFKIPDDPRVRVDTHPRIRSLDVNDHIINFLHDHAPIPDDGHGAIISWPELAYDKNGKAIAPPKAEVKKPVEPDPTDLDSDRDEKDATATPPPAGMPTAPAGKRRLYACDVIASAELEKEFNAYMKAHGQKVRINCGTPDGKRLNWKSSECDGVNQAGIRAAQEIFLTAYRAKGYFPAKPDPAPTAAQSLAYYRMIAEYTPPPDGMAAPIRFDYINAPWPVLVFLAQDDQPLRVRGDIWDRWRLKREFHGYGEYVGGIAQCPPMLQARRLTPYNFDYNTFQMMLKDGGVCGTMANIYVRNAQALGTPASTGGQPGHCALINFVRGKAGEYACVGGQYATGGDADTGCHRPYVFGGATGRDMPAQQSVAYAVNAGTRSFLETLAAYNFVESLSERERKEHALPTLKGLFTTNPYSVPLVEAAQSVAPTPLELIRVRKAHLEAMQALKGKPGCPASTISARRLDEIAFDKLATIPLPSERAQAAEILAYLRDAKCPVAKLTTDYQIAVEGDAGQKALAEKLTADFTAHLDGKRTPELCVAMAERIKALAESKCSSGVKSACLKKLKTLIAGKASYRPQKGDPKTTASLTDECAAALAKISA